jgi:DNA-binding MarR family transcriptional regulator
VKLLAITPEGRRLRQELETTIVETSPVIGGLTADERQTLRELLGKAIGHSGGTLACGPRDV